MGHRLENNWDIFTGTAIKSAKGKLKKRNYKYQYLMYQMNNIQQKVLNILDGSSEAPEEKQLNLLKEYIRICKKKENFESVAIYSQGVYDTVSLLEKFR